MANIFEFLSKDGNITPEKARKSRQMQLCDKTAYVWGLCYRWDPSLSRNPVSRFPHFMPPWSQVLLRGDLNGSYLPFYLQCVSSLARDCTLARSKQGKRHEQAIGSSLSLWLSQREDWIKQSASTFRVTQSIDLPTCYLVCWPIQESDPIFLALFISAKFAKFDFVKMWEKCFWCLGLTRPKISVMIWRSN